ncbi:ATP-binding cassette domain-containing protein, partial [Lactobacillus helveticus]
MKRIALIGPNGIGKSTLLNLIRNKIQPDHGRIIHHGEINYIPQIDYTDTINNFKSVGEKRLTLIENTIWLP